MEIEIIQQEKGGGDRVPVGENDQNSVYAFMSLLKNIQNPHTAAESPHLSRGRCCADC